MLSKKVKVCRSQKPEGLTKKFVATTPNVKTSLKNLASSECNSGDFAPDKNRSEESALTENRIEDSTPVKNRSEDFALTKRCSKKSTLAKHDSEEFVPSDHRSENLTPVKHSLENSVSSENRSENSIPSELYPKDFVSAKYISENPVPIEHCSDKPTSTKHCLENSVPSDHRSENPTSTKHYSKDFEPSELLPVKTKYHSKNFEKDFESAEFLLPAKLASTDHNPKDSESVKHLLKSFTATKQFEAIYVRKSKVKKDSLSIEGQIEMCRQKCIGNNIRIYKEKEGTSGKNIDRPEFQRLMNDVQSGKIESIIVYKLDRFSRSKKDFYNTKDILKKHNAKLFSVNENFDFLSPSGELLETMVVGFAELERTQVVERITDALIFRLEHGLVVGLTPFGFKKTIKIVESKNYKILALDETIMPTIKEVFERYAKPDCSIHSLQKIMPTRVPAQISKMLSDPIYTLANQEVVDFLKSLGCQFPKPDEEYIGKGIHLTLHKANSEIGYFTMTRPNKKYSTAYAMHKFEIVPPDIWIACNKKLSKNITFAMHPNNIAREEEIKSSWILGNICCGHCGYSVHNLVRTMQKSKIERKYLICRTRSEFKLVPQCQGLRAVKTNDIESEVLQRMRDYMAKNEEQIINKNLETKKYIRKLLSQIEILDDEIVKNASKFNSYMPKILLDVIVDQVKRLTSERDELRQELENYEKPLERDFIILLGEKLKNFENLTFKEKCKVKNVIINKITISQTIDKKGFDASGFIDRYKYKFITTHLDIEWKISA